MSGLSYKESGVDIQKADAFVDHVTALAQATHGDQVVPATAAFAGLIRPNLQGMADPLLAAACDGVGTKLLVAHEHGAYRGLGQDLVAMSVNDLLPVGARPLLFLDYIATGKLNPDALTQIVAGIADACKATGCVLLGGETAEMPGLYAPGHFDLAGFAVGVVDANNVPKPEALTDGDVVLALPSSGIHANGFSLARAALFEKSTWGLNDTPPGIDACLGDVLLEPTCLYVRPVLDAMAQVSIKAHAHVTGGGLLGRASKLGQSGYRVVIDPNTYMRPKIFDVIQSSGAITDSEMARTFNMGLGYLVIVTQQDAEQFAEPWRRVGTLVHHAQGGADLGYAQT